MGSPPKSPPTSRQEHTAAAAGEGKVGWWRPYAPLGGRRLVLDFLMLDRLLRALGRRNSAAAKTVRQLHAQCVDILAETLVKELRTVVEHEAGNALDWYLIPPWEVTAWISRCRHADLFRQTLCGGFRQAAEMKATADFWRSCHNPSAAAGRSWWWSLRTTWPDGVSWPSLQEWFSAPFWPQWADAYGGRRWERIAVAGERFSHAVAKPEPPACLAGRICGILNLRHNTGFLCEKLGALKVSRASIREDVPHATAKTVDDLLNRLQRS